MRELFYKSLRREIMPGFTRNFVITGMVLFPLIGLSAFSCEKPEKENALTKGRLQEEQNLLRALADSRQSALENALSQCDIADIDNDESEDSLSVGFISDEEAIEESLDSHKSPRSKDLQGPVKNDQSTAVTCPLRIVHFTELDSDFQTLIRELCAEHIDVLMEGYRNPHTSLGDLVKEIAKEERLIASENASIQTAYAVSSVDLETSDAAAFLINFYAREAALKRLKAERDELLGHFKNDPLTRLQMEEYAGRILKLYDIREEEEVTKLLDYLGYPKTARIPPES